MPPSTAGISFLISDFPDVPRSRTRASDLETPSRGIRRFIAGEESFASSVMPYPRSSGDCWISHVSAARFHGIPLSSSLSDDTRLHLTYPPGSAGIRRRGVVGRRLLADLDNVVDVDGMRVTSVKRTWVDLATILHPADHVAASDFLVRCHRRPFGSVAPPRVALEDLRTYLSQQRRVHGLPLARQSLERLRVCVDSPPESMIRLLLEDAGLPVFEVEQPLVNQRGIAVLWPDLGNKEYRTAVEHDGAHHLMPEQQALDMRRDALTAELDWAQVKVNRLDLRKCRQPEGSAAALPEPLEV